MRFLFNGRGSDPFFWSSTIAVLGLLVAYFLVVFSAGLSVLRSSGREGVWKLLIPAVASVAIAYTLWVSIYPVQQGAYGVIPWIVLGWCLLPLIFLLIREKS
jgi:amino acid transporter